MARTKDVITVILSAAVGSGGSFTASYPTGRTADDYLGAGDHQLITHFSRALMANEGDFTVTFGASNMTVTSTTNVSFPVGATVYLHLDRAEVGQGADGVNLANSDKMSLLQLVKIAIGAPLTASATAVAASQSVLAATVAGAVINGAQAAGGKVVLNHARNIVAAWTGTAVLTVDGLDDFGNAMRESSASGTSFTGKKAFKEVTKATVSADVTGLTVGTGVILGLPVFLPDAADVVLEAMDGAKATAGTTVAGDQTVATALTGDIRGTYSPNSAPNGSRFYELTVALRDPSYKGRSQFAG